MSPAAGRPREEGAMLIMVLAIVTIMAIGTLAVVQLGFSTSKATSAFSSRERLVNALDSGLAAAVENLRLDATDECTDAALALDDADNAAVTAPGAQAINVRVTCEERAGSFHFVVTGYQVQVCDPPNTDPTSLSPRLEADVDITTIKAEVPADNQRVSTVVSRYLATEAPPCEEPEP